jgi:hypothetical protein
VSLKDLVALVGADLLGDAFGGSGSFLDGR